jgi:hypothetical protein
MVQTITSGSMLVLLIFLVIISTVILVRRIIITIPDPYISTPHPGFGCPNCGNTKFWVGPEGGITLNICCNKCYKAYSYMYGLTKPNKENEIRNDYFSHLIEIDITATKK